MSLRSSSAARAGLALAVCVLLSSLVAVGLRNGADSGGPVPGGAIGEAAAGVRPTAAPALATSEPTTSETLPTPVIPPLEDYIDEPEVVLGRLEVPALGLDATLYQGISLTAIDRGPSHWPGTALPGRLGNTVVAGHRVSKSRPFRNMDQLELGDTATFTTADGVFTYEFTGQEIVTPDRVDIADQRPEYMATFYACHPPGSAQYRIVSHWRLISPPAPTELAASPPSG